MSSSVMTPLLWIGAALSLSWCRAEPTEFKMPQPRLERRQGAFGATRFYRRDDPTSPLFLVRRGADGAVDHHRADGALPKLFHRASLGPCAGARHRHDARPGKAHGQRRSASHRPRPGPRFRALPPRAQPGAMEQRRHRPQTAADDPRQVLAHRTGRDRHRRHHRAPLGPQDRGARHLPRSRALLAWSLRQDQRLALARRDGHGSRAMDPATLGFAVSHHPRRFRTLRRRPRASTQEADRLGSPGHSPGSPMAAASAVSSSSPTPASRRSI